MCNLLGQTWGEILDLTLTMCYVLCYFLLVLMYTLYLIVSFVKVVRSDQGGSRNLFSENANTSFHVTLVFDDSKHFRAHKGSNHKSYNVLIL